MNKLLAVAIVLIFSLPLSADDSEFDAEQFVADYLTARTATQQPDVICVRE